MNYVSTDLWMDWDALVDGQVGLGKQDFNFLVRTAFQFVSCTPDSGEGPEKAIPSLASELRQTATAQTSSNDI